MAWCTVTPAWEQTWNVAYGYEQSVPGAHVYDESGLVVASEDTLRDECAAVIACAPEAIRLLLDVECVLRDHSPDGTKELWLCTQCAKRNVRDTGSVDETTVFEHEADCAWLALMKKAGVR